MVSAGLLQVRVSVLLLLFRLFTHDENAGLHGHWHFSSAANLLWITCVSAMTA